MVGTVERALRSATALGFALPVALPPAGRYEAGIRTPGGSVRHRELEIDDQGVRIEPAVPSMTGARLIVDLIRPTPA